uniref:Uncharacterized protein n=1 Tax=Quercus lobata TaxID=97700 RepID=A0A7N2L909_QUELO
MATATKQREFGLPSNSKRKIDAVQKLSRVSTASTVKTLGIAAHSKKINFSQSSHTFPGKYPPRILRDMPTTCDFSPGCGKPVPTSSKIGVFNGKSSEESKQLISDDNYGRHAKKIRIDRNKEQKDVWNPEQSGCSGDSKANKSREQVVETKKLFRNLFSKKQREQIAKEGKKNSATGIKLAKSLEKEGKWVNRSKQIGPVPGVEVGDLFYSAAEMNVVGLHHQFQSGIDYLKGLDGKLFATSILVSCRYDNDMKSTDSFTYTGQGGNPLVGRVEPKDQKFTCGNLALKNSLEAGKPVRRKSKAQKNISRVNYISQGNKKIPTLVVNADICVNDISQGKEKIPIRVVNAKDDERPPFFHYIANVTYPKFYKIFTPIGCDCTDGCLDSNKCFCAMRNGGEISYDSKGRIVKKKSLVYECGPSCKCSSSCMNRVSQLDGRFKLEIFKTELKGWGVRTLSYIPSGSFICEYIGEILHDEGAKRGINKDNYQKGSFQEEGSPIPWRSQSISVDRDYIIDATQSGNVGRFINHSSSPNVFAQNVWYDHDDKRFPHIMLFASKDIPPPQELTYDHYKKRKTCEKEKLLEIVEP